MAKVLWLSDAGCTTGFARVTHSIGERLVEDYGHQIYALATNYRGDSWNCERPGHDHVTPLRLFRPDTVVGNDIYGRARIIEMLARVEPDVVVFVSDPQVILNTLFANIKDPERILLRYRPILAYIPCDGTNLPPTWTEILPKVTNVIAMSEWGQRFYQPSKVVYHGIDQEVFWPISEKPKTTSSGVVCKTKADCKRAFGLDPDTFLVGRVDTNSGRKDYAALIKALWPVMEKFSDVEAWFHCEDEAPNVGLRMQDMLLRNADKVKPSRFHFPGLHTSFEGWPIEDLNVLYSAFDVVVSPSRGEGAGLGNMEALACGIPVIAQNVSAIPEYVGPGGILLEPSGYMSTPPSGEDTWLPDIPAFTEAIERVYRSKGLRRDLGQAGVEHIRALASWDVAAQAFDEYITELEHFEPPVPSTDTSSGGDQP
jgi:glycosyltransferase involved in cell wall biosynthesis